MPTQSITYNGDNIKAVITDIEGTITSISFVKEVLFPYSLVNLERILRSEFDSWTDTVNSLKELSREKAKTEAVLPIDMNDRDEIIKHIVHNVTYWINMDRKYQAVKELQGRIWNFGYLEGKLHGHLYDDVIDLLKDHHEQLPPFYIYSSGSVAAQKLLVTHSVAGDMSQYFSGYFDTGVGAKADSSSYKNICQSLKVEPQESLFLTDVEAEAVAAHAAGLHVCLLVRDGNAPLSKEAKANFRTATTLTEVFKDIVRHQ